MANLSPHEEGTDSESDSPDTGRRDIGEMGGRREVTKKPVKAVTRRNYTLSVDSVFEAMLDEIRAAIGKPKSEVLRYAVALLKIAVTLRQANLRLVGVDEEGRIVREIVMPI